MFGLTEWQQTRFYQEVEQEVKERVKEEIKQEVREEIKKEVKQEGKLEAIPGLLKMGLSIEQIAQALKLKVEDVRKAVANQSEEES